MRPLYVSGLIRSWRPQERSADGEAACARRMRSIASLHCGRGLHLSTIRDPLRLEKELRVSRTRRGKHHDLGQYPDYPRANVLLSRDFRYFGIEGKAQYKSKFPRIDEPVERLGRGTRVRLNEELRRELIEMADWIWRSTKRKVMGQPTSGPSRKACLRSGPCGVV